MEAGKAGLLSKRMKVILSLSVCVLLSGYSHNIKANDKKTTQLTDILKRKAINYALICYRPGASLAAGSTDGDWRRYRDELMEQIDKIKPGSNSGLELQRTHERLKKFLEKFDDKIILECAKRNFSYLSHDDLQWFQIFDEYGQEIDNFSEGFFPYKETILNSHLIMIGNHHAFSTQGDILFGLTNFIEQQKSSAAALLVEMREDSLKQLKNKISSTFSSPIEDTEAASQELAQIFLNDIRKQNESAARLFEMMHMPRIKTWIRYHLQFPKIPMLSIEQRKDLDSRDPAFTTLSLHQLLQSFEKKKRWLAYYGNSHVLRFLNSETYQIEKELVVEGQPARIFIISQGFGLMNLLAQHAVEFGSRVDLIQTLADKFAFPNPPLALDPAQTHVYNNWDQRIQKYNSFRKHGHAKPIFVNLFQARRDGKLKFHGDIAPADLLVIPPSDAPSNARFDFEKDAGYQYLAQFIGKIK